MSFFLSEELVEKINIENLAEDEKTDNALFIFEDFTLKASFLSFKKKKNKKTFLFLANNIEIINFLFLKKEFKLSLANQDLTITSENITFIKEVEKGKFKIAIELNN